MVARRRREAIVKLEIIEQCQQFCRFFEFFVLKQQSILRCFCSLKSEKDLFSNKFFSLIFRSKIIAHTDEMDQIKCFDQK